MMQHRQLRYIGLDVHTATIAVAIAEEEGSPSSYGTIANDPSPMRKLMTATGWQGRGTAGRLRSWADRVCT